MTAWGWFFDVATVLISLTDVVSDILVAVQFYRDGEMTWFWLVMSSLILSNIIYTGFVVEILIREDECMGPVVGRFFRPVQYLLVFPLAQLMPSLRWIKEQIWPSKQSKALQLQFASEWDVEVTEHSDAATRSKLESRAIREEIEESAVETEVMSRLDTALKEHIRSHLLFYIETVVESVPQSIIQLLAVTFLNQASSLQVFSMSLSLISIVSKGYVFSRSANAKMVAQKFLFAAHDVFSLFYIFSTILSSERPQEVRLFGTELYISYLSYVWLMAVAVTLGLVAIVLLYYWVLNVVDICRTHRCCTLDTLLWLGAIPLSVLCSIPAAIAGVAVQLIWIGLFVTGQESPPEQYPACGRLYSFINYNSGENWDERTKFIMTKHVLKQEAAAASCPTSWYRSERISAMRESLKECLSEEPFRAWTLIPRVTIKYYFACRMLPDLKQQIGQVIGTIAMIAYVVLQVFTFAFPFISYGTYFHQQNLLQHFCFIALCAPMALSVLLVPETVRYVAFCLEMRPVIWTWDVELLRRIMLWIAEYHLPPHQAIILQIVPHQLLPLDIAEHLAGFLGQDAVNTGDLSVEQCRGYKELWNARKRDENMFEVEMVERT